MGLGVGAGVGTPMLSVGGSVGAVVWLCVEEGEGRDGIRKGNEKASAAAQEKENLLSIDQTYPSENIHDI